MIPPPLLVLLALWALLLFGGFIFGRPDPLRARRMPAWTRLASSAVLVVSAWGWHWLGRDAASASGYTLLVAAGMSLGFLGDLFMARLLPVSEPVVGGILAFGLGHLAYLAAFLPLGRALPVQPRAVALVAWLLVGLVGWRFVVWRGRAPRRLRLAALPYTLLLAGTAGLALGLALGSAAFIPLAIGGALFLLSDLILAAQIFNDAHLPYIGDLVWFTYGPGQMLIVYGAAAALRL